MAEHSELAEPRAAYGFDDSPADRQIDHPDWFKTSFLDLREDLDEAIAADKRGLLVYFGQDDCAYCQALMEVNFALPDVVDYTRRHFDVVAVDIWGAREVVDMTGSVMTEREYAVANDTNFTPSFIFYDESAREVFRIRGYYPPYRFRAALEYAADGHYATETFRDYLERANPPPKFELEDLNEQPFFDSPPYVLDRSRYPTASPLAVFFEQRDCHACDVLHSAPLADEHVRTLLGSMQVVQLDMWSGAPVLTPVGRRLTAREWAAALDITWAPTLVFFDAHGREIIRIDSVVQQYRLGRVLEYVAEGGYASGLNYQQWHRRRTVEPVQP